MLNYLFLMQAVYFFLNVMFFCSTPLVRFSKVNKALMVFVYNADFKSPKAQKSFGDAPGDLEGISVMGIILIPVLCSIFSSKAIMECDMLCFEAFQRIDGIVIKSLEFHIKNCR